MKISVILCTYNRSQQLAIALESLVSQNVPRELAWEILVIDNNSRDQTRSVVSEFVRRHPGRIRYLFEPKQGKSFALNSGIREARGDILAFIDDDVTAHPAWVANTLRALEDDRYSGTGGRIVPTWTKPQPKWLRMAGPYTLHGVLVAFDFGDIFCDLTLPPFGTNMAFRREVFAKYGGFRTDLGPTVGSEIRGEDTEFCRRVMAAECRIAYVSDAIVYHPVPENRTSKKYFQTWFFDYGRATVRETGVPSGVRCWAGIPRYMVRKLVSTAVRSSFALKPYVRFYYRVRVWKTLGEIVEARRQLQQETV